MSNKIEGRIVRCVAALCPHKSRTNTPCLVRRQQSPDQIPRTITKVSAIAKWQRMVTRYTVSNNKRLLCPHALDALRKLYFTR